MKIQYFDYYLKKVNLYVFMKIKTIRLLLDFFLLDILNLKNTRNKEEYI